MNVIDFPRVMAELVMEIAERHDFYLKEALLYMGTTIEGLEDHLIGLGACLDFAPPFFEPVDPGYPPQSPPPFDEYIYLQTYQHDFPDEVAVSDPVMQMDEAERFHALAVFAIRNARASLLPPRLGHGANVYMESLKEAIEHTCVARHAYTRARVLALSKS